VLKAQKVMNSLIFDFATTSATCNENVSLLSIVIPRSDFVQYCTAQENNIVKLIQLGRVRSLMILYPTSIVQHSLIFNLPQFCRAAHLSRKS